MKIITLFFLFLSGMAYGQVSNIDKEAFLVGTLDEYMGRRQAFTSKIDRSYYQMVDIYFQKEHKLASLIDSLFKGEIDDLHIINNQAPKGIKLHSEKLSKKVNEYYSYEPAKTGNSFEGDPLYVGSLKKEKFVTENQKLAFLAGAYIRNGEPVDNEIKNEVFTRIFEKKAEPGTYWISMPNAGGKAKICKEFLIAEGCTDVEYTVRKDYIPVGHHIAFKPSEKVRKVIEKMDQLKSSLK